MEENKPINCTYDGCLMYGQGRLCRDKNYHLCAVFPRESKTLPQRLERITSERQLSQMRVGGAL